MLEYSLRNERMKIIRKFRISSFNSVKLTKKTDRELFVSNNLKKIRIRHSLGK